MIWKNLIWNYTIRLWYLWKYRNSHWRSFFCSERLNTLKQKRELKNRLCKLLQKLHEKTNKTTAI